MRVPQKVRGTSDLIGDQLLKYKQIDDACCEVAMLFGCVPISTPIIEFEEVFLRPLGSESDIVSKEMYSFLDRSHNKITLRPELTSGIMRAYINHVFDSNKIRVFTSGAVFRYERPQKGRSRQFFQTGIEFIGETSFHSDFEAICLAKTFLDKVIGQARNDDKSALTLELNSLGDYDSRSTYRSELVAYFNKHKSDLSQDSLKRLEKNPLRILDSKEEQDQNLIKLAPNFQDYLNKTSLDFFENLCSLLKQANIEYTINPKLVRGLDYYCHTVFEFKSDKLGTQSTVLAGGRYDYLAKKLGYKVVPSVGWSAGVDRLALLTKLEKETVLKIAIFEHSNQLDADKKFTNKDKLASSALILANNLRLNGFCVQVELEGKLKKLIPKLVKKDYNILLLTNNNDSDKIIYRDLKKMEQSTLSYKQLIDKLTSR